MAIKISLDVSVFDVLENNIFCLLRQILKTADKILEALFYVEFNPLVLL